jgi:hypothetical protein
MKVVIAADDGDELTVNPYQLTECSGFVRVQIQNRAHDSGDEEWITLPSDKARELGCALIAASAKFIRADDHQT